MGINPKRLVPFQLVPFQLVLKQVGSNKLERHLFEQIVFRLEPNESTFCPLNGSRPDESIRSALDYGDLSETFACAFGQSSWNGTSPLSGLTSYNNISIIVYLCHGRSSGSVHRSRICALRLARSGSTLVTRSSPRRKGRWIPPPSL